MYPVIFKKYNPEYTEISPAVVSFFFGCQNWHEYWFELISWQRAVNLFVLKSFYKFEATLVSQNYLILLPDSDVRGYVDDVLAELDCRFAGVDSDALYVTATFLDPRYKLRWCKYAGDEKEAMVRTIVIGMMERVVLLGGKFAPVARTAAIAQVLFGVSLFFRFLNH